METRRDQPPRSLADLADAGGIGSPGAAGAPAARARADTPRGHPEAALQALRRVDPKLRAAIWESRRRDNPLDAPPADDAAEIRPTDLDLVLIYIPGASHQRPIRIFSAGLVSSQWTDGVSQHHSGRQ